MKKTDAKIITQLRSNGRMPLTELSRRTGLPVSTIHERLKQQILRGLVKPCTLLNFVKLGFMSRAHILLSVETAEKEAILLHLKKHPNVNALFKINNGWSLLTECVFPDMQLMELFVEELENTFHIKQKQVHYTLEEIRRESFLSIPEIAELQLEKLPRLTKPLNSTEHSKD